MKLSKSGYRNVSYKRVFGNMKWVARVQLNKVVFETTCESELEAAKQVDLFLMRQGKDPINVFKKKAV